MAVLLLLLGAAAGFGILIHFTQSELTGNSPFNKFIPAGLQQIDLKIWGPAIGSVALWLLIACYQAAHWEEVKEGAQRLYVGTGNINYLMAGNMISPWDAAWGLFINSLQQTWLIPVIGCAVSYVVYMIRPKSELKKTQESSEESKKNAA